MSDDLHQEVERLISIARLHAVNALTRSASERASHLAVCRGFWKHYAAAYTKDERQSEIFVDALDRATRDLIAQMQQNAATIRASGDLHLSDDVAGPQSGNPTLEQLRPIFRQIIER